MINILTAIGNPRLNMELNKYNEFYAICNDIQYKEGILEVLEKNNNVDIVIFNSLLEGQISIEKLIEEINIIDNKIKIIVIIEQKNKEMEDKLISKGVYDFFYNDTELNHIINVLKNNNIEIINRELRKEIDELKILINEKNNKKEKKKIYNKLLKKDSKINEKSKIINNEKRAKTIGVIGSNGCGKSSFIYFASYVLSKKNKVLIIDLNIKNNDLEFFYNLKKEYIEEEKFNINNYIKIIKDNLFIISDLKQIIYDKKINFNFFINKINLIKNNYDFIFFDLNLNEKELEKNMDINLEKNTEENMKKMTKNSEKNKQEKTEKMIDINNILEMCESLITLTLTDKVGLKKTEKLLKNISKNNNEINKKINIILYNNNIINCIFFRNKLIKNNFINYKIIGKMKYFMLYIFYLKKEKNINYNFLFKMKIKKIINKLL